MIASCRDPRRDVDRVARSTHEAQTLAALNHPNIAIICGVEEAAGVRALVMELVDGEELRTRTGASSLRVETPLPSSMNDNSFTNDTPRP